MLDIKKEFKPSSWAIDNKTSIYILAIILTLAGIFGYNSLPKEQFPEVKFPSILVTTVYPGTSPKEIPRERAMAGAPWTRPTRSQDRTASKEHLRRRGHDI